MSLEVTESTASSEGGAGGVLVTLSSPGPQPTAAPRTSTNAIQSAIRAAFGLMLPPPTGAIRSCS
jgi:hypothetical protein